jgi:integrase
VRASELCQLRVADLRLHDPDGARFQIRESKTAAGIREVQMTPDLVETVIDHLDRLRRRGLPTGPEAFVVPGLRGGAMNRQRVAEIIRGASELACRQREDHGLPRLPHTTPHSLRRTYISIALLANSFDVKWVMSQVGHADSKMTLDVYARSSSASSAHTAPPSTVSYARPASSAAPRPNFQPASSFGPRIAHETFFGRKRRR